MASEPLMVPDLHTQPLPTYPAQTCVPVAALRREDDSGDDSEPDDDPASGAVQRGSAQSGGDGASDDPLVDAARRQLDALFRYSVTGDSAYLLAPQRPLMAAQDEDGDTSVRTLA